jgi:hypothetical protein
MKAKMALHLHCPIDQGVHDYAPDVDGLTIKARSWALQLIV